MCAYDPFHIIKRSTGNVSENLTPFCGKLLKSVWEKYWNFPHYSNLIGGKMSA